MGESLTPGVRFSPESQKLDITERGSTSSFSLPIDSGVELSAGDWVKDEMEPGAGIVWRVKSADLTYNTDTRLIQLEHVINTLRDRCVFGEVKASDISGGDTCTAQEAFEYFLAQQSIWELGDFEFNVSQPFSFNGESIFDALTIVSTALDNPVWEYDLTALPFKLHVRQKDSDASCEMRFGRNLSTLRKTEDRTKMYTRLYPIGKGNLHITGDYISKNELVYGRVDKVLTDQSQETEAALLAWATDKLERHCQPIVNITISGLDFSRATGETLDRLVINKVCRVPMPKYGTTILEPIVRLSWKDKIKEPENVSVTLCNNVDDVATFAKEQAASGGRSGRAAAKAKEEDHAWFVDTTSHVAMVAEALVGRDPDLPSFDWSRVSEIIVDGSGIHDTVVLAVGSLIAMEGRQEMTESSLTTAFTRIGGLEGSMVMTAESLTTVFTKTGVDSLGQGETLFSKVAYTASSITQIVSAVGANGTVTASTIVQAINAQTGESIVRVDASKIVLDGQVLATALDATYIRTDNITAQTSDVGVIYVAGLLAKKTGSTGGTVIAPTVSASEILRIGAAGEGQGSATGSLYFRGDQFYNRKLSLGPANSYIAMGNVLTSALSDINMNHAHAVTMTEITSGAHAGEVQATIGAAVPENDSTATDYFDIAATTTYANGVLAARNAVGVNPFTADQRITLNDHRTFTYTTDAPTPASGTSQSDTWYLAGGTGWSSAHKTNVTLRYGSASGTQYATKEVDAGSVYNDGWGAAYGDVRLPHTTGYGSSMTIYTPSQTVGGNAVSTTYTISSDGDHVYIKDANGVSVAESLDVGWQDGYDEAMADAYDSMYTDNTPASGNNESAYSYNQAVSIAGTTKYVWVRIYNQFGDRVFTVRIRNLSN